MDGDSVGQNPNIRNFVNPPCWLWFSPFDQNRIPASLTNANATRKESAKRQLCNAPLAFTSSQSTPLVQLYYIFLFLNFLLPLVGYAFVLTTYLLDKSMYSFYYIYIICMRLSSLRPRSFPQKKIPCISQTINWTTNKLEVPSLLVVSFKINSSAN